MKSSERQNLTSCDDYLRHEILPEIGIGYVATEE